jgi:hypothetical protein
VADKPDEKGVPGAAVRFFLFPLGSIRFFSWDSVSARFSSGSASVNEFYKL